MSFDKHDTLADRAMQVLDRLCDIVEIAVHDGLVLAHFVSPRSKRGSRGALYGARSAEISERRHAHSAWRSRMSSKTSMKSMKSRSVEALISASISERSRGRGDSCGGNDALGAVLAMSLTMRLLCCDALYARANDFL